MKCIKYNFFNNFQALWSAIWLKSSFNTVAGDYTMCSPLNQMLDEMLAIIVQEINPRQVILFGSHARGTARAGTITAGI